MRNMFSQLLASIQFNPRPSSDQRGNFKNNGVHPTWMIGGEEAPANEQRQSLFFMKLPPEIRNEIYEYAILPLSTFDVLQNENFAKRLECEEMIRSAGSEALRNEMDGDDGEAAMNNGESNNKGNNNHANEEDEDEDNEENEKDDITPPPPPPHPLSLLLTCRLINIETTVLAFRLYPHLIRLGGEVTFHHLRQLTFSLRKPCFEAITSVSFGLYQVPYGSGPVIHSVNEYICHSILLSKNVNRAVIRYFPFVTGKEEFDGDLRRGVEQAFHLLDSGSGSGSGSGVQEERETCSKHVPPWFKEVLHKTRFSNTSYKWQNSERWTETWPFRHYDARHHDDQDSDTHVELAHRCRGDCTAVLVQDATGREVAITLKYDFDPFAPKKKPKSKMNIKLVPGTPGMQAAGAVTCETGFGYEPEEKYWEKLRRRNGGGSGSGSGNGSGDSMIGKVMEVVWRGEEVRAWYGSNVK